MQYSGLLNVFLAFFLAINVWTSPGFCLNWQDVALKKLTSSSRVLDPEMEWCKKQGTLLCPNETEARAIANFVGREVVLSIGTENGLLEGLLEKRHKVAIITTKDLSLKKSLPGYCDYFTEITPFFKEFDSEWSDAGVLLIYSSLAKADLKKHLKRFSGEHLIFFGEKAPHLFQAENDQVFQCIQRNGRASFYKKNKVEPVSLTLNAKIFLARYPGLRKEERLAPLLRKMLCDDYQTKNTPPTSLQDIRFDGSLIELLQKGTLIPFYDDKVQRRIYHIFGPRIEGHILGKFLPFFDENFV